MLWSVVSQKNKYKYPDIGHEIKKSCFQMEHDYEMDKKSGTKNQDHRGDIISHHNNHSVIEDAFETS